MKKKTKKSDQVVHFDVGSMKALHDSVSEETYDWIKNFEIIQYKRFILKEFEDFEDIAKTNASIKGMLILLKQRLELNNGQAN